MHEPQIEQSDDSGRIPDRRAGGDCNRLKIPCFKEATMLGGVISVRRAVPLIASALLIASCQSNGMPTEGENATATHGSSLSHGQSDGERLPVRGVYHATSTVLFDPGAAGSEERCSARDLHTLAFTLEGHASHLGRFTGTGSNCTPFPVPGPVAVTDGIFAVTAANGDGLVGNYEGVQDAVSADLSATFETVMDITGGTGRFTNALGMWADEGTIDFNTGATSATFAGWIIHDASSAAR